MDDYGAPSAVEAARNGRRAPSGDDVYFAEYGTCPDHNKPWREKNGRYFCATKNADGSWCNEKPTQQWVEMAKAVAA